MLEEVGIDGNAVAVIRHSERPSFDNLPCHEWEKVGLTAKGNLEATKFGAFLGRFQTVRSFQVFGWGEKRCVETAEAISKGAQRESAEVIGPVSINLKSPIADRIAYDKALFSFKWDLWDRMISDWLIDETPQTIMLPARKWAKEICHALISKTFCLHGKISIIVTHDLHILPVCRLFFPSASRSLDYLNGVVLKVNCDQVIVGFNGEYVKIKNKESL